MGCKIEDSINGNDGFTKKDLVQMNAKDLLVDLDSKCKKLVDDQGKSGFVISQLAKEVEELKSNIPKDNLDVRGEAQKQLETLVDEIKQDAIGLVNIASLQKDSAFKSRGYTDFLQAVESHSFGNGNLEEKLFTAFSRPSKIVTIFRNDTEGKLQLPTNRLELQKFLNILSGKEKGKKYESVRDNLDQSGDGGSIDKKNQEENNKAKSSVKDGEYEKKLQEQDPNSALIEKFERQIDDFGVLTDGNFDINQKKESFFSDQNNDLVDTQYGELKKLLINLAKKKILTKSLKKMFIGVKSNRKEYKEQRRDFLAFLKKTDENEKIKMKGKMLEIQLKLRKKIGSTYNGFNGLSKSLTALNIPTGLMQDITELDNLSKLTVDEFIGYTKIHGKDDLIASLKPLNERIDNYFDNQKLEEILSQSLASTQEENQEEAQTTEFQKNIVDQIGSPDTPQSARKAITSKVGIILKNKSKNGQLNRIHVEHKIPQSYHDTLANLEKISPSIAARARRIGANLLEKRRERSQTNKGGTVLTRVIKQRYLGKKKNRVESGKITREKGGETERYVEEKKDGTIKLGLRGKSGLKVEADTPNITGVQKKVLAKHSNELEEFDKKNNVGEKEKKAFRHTV